MGKAAVHHASTYVRSQGRSSRRVIDQVQDLAMQRTTGAGSFGVVATEIPEVSVFDLSME